MMPMMDIYKPPVGYGEAQQEVDATPSPADASGMQVPLAKPTHEKALHGEWSTMFMPQRFHVGVGVTIAIDVPNIPRSWVVYVDRGGGVGALAQVVQGNFDVTLTIGDDVTFPGRSKLIFVTVTVAECDVTVIALGDDLLRF